MGTVLEVTVVATDKEIARELADAALAEARRWDDLLTTWRPEGELARLNSEAGVGSFTVSEELAGALRRMQALTKATGGAFDPAVGPLVELWRGPNVPVSEVAAHIGPHRIAEALILRDRQATLAPGAALDAGGIGKGFALDAMADRLRAGGAEAAFLDFGGSSQLAIGHPAENPEGWKLAVAGLSRGHVHGVILLRDAALSTSRATGAGAPEGPIIDPCTGRPVAAPRMVTVFAADATTAEAWSTALVVEGRDGLERLTALGLDALYEDADGVERTPGFMLKPVHDLSTD